MRFPSISSLLTAATALSLAGMTAGSAIGGRDAPKGGYTKNCTRYYLATNGAAVGQFVGICRATKNGNDVTTVLDLNRCLANSNGALVWQPDGGAFKACGACSQRTSDPKYVDCAGCGSINLDEGVYLTEDGTLGCGDILGFIQGSSKTTDDYSD